MVSLSVPYKSQWDHDANATKNNCGPACIAMLLSFYGKTVATNDVFSKTGAGNGVISIKQLQAAISTYGFTSECRVGVSFDEMKQLLDLGTPFIALVHAGALTSRQDQKFTGGHFLDVVGYREDGYFVNDPNYWDKFRQDGDHHFYKKEDFENAVMQCDRDQNPNATIIIIKPSDDPGDPLVCDKKSVRDKLVRKASSTDKIGHFLALSQDVIDSDHFADVVIATMQKIQEEANKQPSNPASEAPSTPTPPESLPTQPNPEVKKGVLQRINGLLSFLGITEVKQ